MDCVDFAYLKTILLDYNYLEKALSYRCKIIWGRNSLSFVEIFDGFEIGPALYFVSGQSNATKRAARVLSTNSRVDSIIRNTVNYVNS